MYNLILNRFIYRWFNTLQIDRNHQEQINFGAHHVILGCKQHGYIDAVVIASRENNPTAAHTPL